MSKLFSVVGGSNILRVILLTAIFLSPSVFYACESYNEFIEAYIKGDNINRFIHPGELRLSGRLGINYEGVNNKFLIANDLDSGTRENLVAGKLKYTCTVDTLDNKYTRLFFEIPETGITREFYFNEGLLVSTPYYYAREWQTVESRFFVFHLSDPAHTNEYAINKLDNFVDKTLRAMQADTGQINKLEKEKIHYYLCGNESEIEKLTGYKARGMYYLAADYIISTYNSHYHEVVHLLTNYMLGDIPLYTNPFLQEGLAVALGGRGGRSPEVLFEMARFIVNSGFLDYTGLLSAQGFAGTNASMAYPISGLYVDFIIKNKGFSEFIKLYLKYSGDNETVSNTAISEDDLPGKKEWNNYLAVQSDTKTIDIDIEEYEFPDTVLTGEKCNICANDSLYLFEIKDYFLFYSGDTLHGYTSRLFEKLLPGIKYDGARYLVTADSAEISVYDLCTGTLIAKYVQGFTLTQSPVPHKNGYYLFVIDKNKRWQDLRIQ